MTGSSRNHFYGDPVMPGSLGVEVNRARIGPVGPAKDRDMSTHQNLNFSSQEPFTWKYRGQVLPANRQTYFEAHIKNIVH